MQDQLNKFIRDLLEDDQIAQAQASANAQGLYDLTYHTDWVNDSEYAIFQFVAQAEIAPLIASLVISSDDEGVNGTQYWDLSYWLTHTEPLPNLNKFALPLNTQNPDNHNRIITTYADMYEENGALAKLLDKCPQLEILHSPSAPNASFFERKTHPLKHLLVQTGFAHQNFIRNLADSTCFSQLETLDFTDYAETYMKDFAQHCVPLEDYQALFQSNALPALDTVILKSLQLDEAQKNDLIARAQVNSVKLLFQ